jgi:hypothetical protein
MGVGQQMAALEVVQANLISSVPGIVTNATGGKHFQIMINFLPMLI